MAKKLTAKPIELDGLLGAANKIPPSKISNVGKISSFRRALKLGLKDYSDGIESFMTVFREDHKELVEKMSPLRKVITDKKTKKADKEKAEEEVKNLIKATKDIQEEANKKMTEFQEENATPIEVTFDSEAFNETKIALEESAQIIYGMSRKDAEGKIVEESYDVGAVDTLFELLEKAV